MNYLLDTCVLSDVFKKTPSVVKRFEAALPAQIHILTLSVMEIEYGLKLNPVKEIRIRPVWNSLLELIQIIPYSSKCATETALVRSQLKSAGMPIGPYDILIAGTAIAYDLTIVSSNCSEFNRIPGLNIEDWRVA